jgi:hypothetical protein
MLHIKRFHKNGTPAWDIKASAIVIAVVALVILGFLTGEHSAAAVTGLFK